MENIYANVELFKPVDLKPATNQKVSRSSARRFSGSVLCLGLLCVSLLAGLIGLAYHASSVELHARVSELTEEINRLQNLTTQNECVPALAAAAQHDEKMCPEGWVMFNMSCYFTSPCSGSWDRGRDDCRGRGAELAIINSPEEEAYLVRLIDKDTWIGLSDKDIEGTWKWLDGTPLTLGYWRNDQPDNFGEVGGIGGEDCVHISSAYIPGRNWNDLPCKASNQWICEKMA